MEILYSILFFTGLITLFHLGRYVVLAGGAYRLFWGTLRPWTERLRLQPGPSVGRAFPRAQLRREFGNSVKTSILFGIIFAPSLVPEIRDRTAIYLDVQEYGILYLILSFLILVIVNDTYFYWMHRTIHHPRLFKRIHAVHHESRSPNPMTAYSFSVSEGILEFIWIWPLMYFMPIHEKVLIAFGIFALILNIVGHLGFEIYPTWAKDHWAFKWMNKPTYHDEHHRLSRGNYGLYFTFWDRAMGTLRDKTKARVVKPAQVLPLSS